MSKVSENETDFNRLLDSSLSMENRLELLKSAIISNEGLNHDFVSELEKISPGCILDNKPRGLIIHEPNPQNLEYAVESIDRLRAVLTVGLIGAVIMMIMKFFSRFGSGGDGGGGGGGGGSFSIKDPKETIDNLLENDEKVKKQIQENVDKINDQISAEVMLIANIKSDTIHLLKRCGKTDTEIESLTKNEQSLRRYLTDVKQLEQDVRWHNGGHRLPVYLTSSDWHTRLNELDTAIREISKVHKQRWDWAINTQIGVGTMAESINALQDLFNHSATSPFSAAQHPKFNLLMTGWISDLGINSLHAKEPTADLFALKELSRKQPIDGRSIQTDFQIDTNRQEVSTYFSNRIKSIRFHDNKSPTRMPNINEFPKRLDEFQKVVTHAQYVITDVSQEFTMHKTKMDGYLEKMRERVARRLEIPIEPKRVIYDGITYALNNLQFIANLLGALMSLRGIFEEVTKAYREGIEALEIVNRDLENLLKRLEAAKEKLEKDKEHNDVHEH